jgi:hypothetical protein
MKKPRLSSNTSGSIIKTPSMDVVMIFMILGV